MLGFKWGLIKERTLLNAALIPGSAEISVVLLRVFLFPYYFSSRGFCNLCINIFIWLCNCIKINRNLGGSMRERNISEEGFRFFFLLKKYPYTV